MKKIIEGPGDVAVLVQSFYAKVLEDELLGPFFKVTAESRWQEHLDIMNRFWCNILFYSGEYVGNPFKSHQVLHLIKIIQPLHFKRWEQLFLETVDTLFTGEKAELAKQRTLAISAIMQQKILQHSAGYAES
jgi:hemoglobin